jgi:hypothetical protein
MGVRVQHFRKPTMNQADLEYLHNQLRLLEQQLMAAKAPGTIIARAYDALLAVEWLIKKVK